MNASAPTAVFSSKSGMLQNMSINGRITIGFGLVVAILVGISIQAYVGFNQSNKNFSTYRDTVLVTNELGRVEASLVLTQLNVKEFIFSGSESAIEEARNRANATLQYVETAKSMEKSDEDIASLEVIAHNMRSYLESFEILIGKRVERNAIVFDTINPTGTKMRKGMQEIIDMAYRDGDSEAVRAGAIAKTHLMLARFYVSDFLVTNAQSSVERVYKEITAFDAALSNLLTERQSPRRRALTTQIQADMATYNQGFGQAVEIILSRNEIIETHMGKIGPKIAQLAEALKLSNKKKQDTIGPALVETFATLKNTMIIAAAIATALAVLISIIIARSIVRPIVGMTEAMTSLATGKMETQVPAQNQKDEVGKMAQAVNTFKESTILAAALAEEQQIAKHQRTKDERLSLATTSAGLGIWDYDFENDRLIWDQKMFEIYGVEPETFRGDLSAWLDCLHPGDHKNTTDEFKKAIDNHEPFNAQFRIVCADGTTRHVSADTKIFYDANNLPERAIGVNANITERINLEQQLQHSQRIDAVGKLTGGIAHDFNNILHVISGNSQLIEMALNSEFKDNAKLEKYMANVLSGVDRASSLTGRLLSFSRQDILMSETFDVSELFDNELDDLLHRTLGEQIDIRIAVNSGPNCVKTDLRQLENAIINLAVNARDAMQGGGVLLIDVSTKALDQATPVIAGKVLPGKYVEIAITDTGEGIKSEDIEKVIEPFYTTKDVGKGSGLGLSMVYGFVQQSGGYFHIHSDVGQGTTIKIYLPLVSDDELTEADAIKNSTLTPNVTKKSYRVLVVEDDEDVREITTTILINAGYDVVEAETAIDALGLLKQEPGKFDLMFTDIILPGGKTGLELAREVKRLQPHIKTLFTSGYTEQFTDPAEGLEVGKNLLRKPYMRVDLLNCLSELLVEPAIAERVDANE